MDSNSYLQEIPDETKTAAPTKQRFNQQPTHEVEDSSVWMPHSWEARELVRQQHAGVSLLPCYRVGPRSCPMLTWLLQKRAQMLFLCLQAAPWMHPATPQYSRLLHRDSAPSIDGKSLETCQGHPHPSCSLALALHFLRGLRSRFTGGGSRSEGSSGKGLVSFSVLTTGKVKVAELGLMGM